MRGRGKDTVTEVGGNDGEEGAPGDSLVLTYFIGRALKVEIPAFSYVNIFYFVFYILCLAPI